MRKLTYIAIALSTAATLSSMPVSAAQTNTQDAGIPYEITFDGSFYPSDLEAVTYPYLAASQERSGNCTLKLISDQAGNIASMSIMSCSDDLFRSAATRYISNQDFSGNLSSDLRAHELRISWDIGAQLDRAPLQIATR